MQLVVIIRKRPRDSVMSSSILGLSMTTKCGFVGTGVQQDRAVFKLGVEAIDVAVAPWKCIICKLHADSSRFAYALLNSFPKIVILCMQGLEGTVFDEELEGDTRKIKGETRRTKAKQA